MLGLICHIKLTATKKYFLFLKGCIMSWSQPVYQLVLSSTEDASYSPPRITDRAGKIGLYHCWNFQKKYVMEIKLSCRSNSFFPPGSKFSTISKISIKTYFANQYATYLDLDFLHHPILSWFFFFSFIAALERGHLSLRMLTGPLSLREIHPLFAEQHNTNQSHEQLCAFVAPETKGKLEPWWCG